jgi:hypothetical protein
MAFSEKALKNTDIFEENVQFLSIYGPTIKLRQTYVRPVGTGAQNG